MTEKKRGMRMYTAELAREELVSFGRKIDAKGLVVGPGGNTSIRAGDTVYLKASGVAFEDATEEDYIGVDLKTGEIVDGSGRPTCEILMHLGCYLVRDDINAVVHTHAPLATGVASTGTTLKATSPDFVAFLGTEVPVIKFVVPAGRELADEVTPVIKNCDAVLMTNHGILTVGVNMKEAYYRNVLVEEGARTFLAGKLAGSLRYLTEKEADDVNNLEAEDYRRALLSGM